MTLLESLIATVLLAVVAIACLEGTRGAVQLQQRHATMVTSLARAEAVLAGEMAEPSTSATATSAGARVRRTPYAADSGGTRLELVEVEVPIAGGGTVRLARLIERAR